MNKKHRLIFIISFCFAAVAILIGYTLYTGHIWEDFFITFRCSKNLVDGNGLVYEIGEKVHTFTSPLGVLLPAFTYILTGKQSFVEAIWFFRILFCVPAFVVGGIYLLKMLSENYRIQNYNNELSIDRISYIPLVFIALLYLFDVKSVMFTMNGMETGLMLFFFIWSLYLMIKGIDNNWVMTGVAWGGLMWTRPDSFIYIASIMITSVFFCKKNDSGYKIQDTGYNTKDAEEDITSNLGHPISKSELKTDTNKTNTPLLQYAIAPFKQWLSERQTVIISIVKAAAVTTVIYLPWFAWAWWYYGSPVPNTVLAKSAVNSFELKNLFTNIIINSSWAFSPVYPNLSKWPVAIKYFSICATIFCFCYWFFKINDRLGKSLSFTYFLLSIYFGLMPFPYPWYFPPLTILGYIIIINGIWHLFRKIQYPSFILITCYSVIFINVLLLFCLTTYQMKMQQKLIENGLRKQIGFWMKDHIEKDDTIYLEPLGYIGYFSGAKMLDYPGLCAPEVIRLLNQGHNFFSVINELKPDWIIVRPSKRQELESIDDFSENYKHVGDFSSIQKIKDAGYIPGKGYLEYDSAYKLYRKIK